MFLRCLWAGMSLNKEILNVCFFCGGKEKKLTLKSLALYAFYGTLFRGQIRVSYCTYFPNGNFDHLRKNHLLV